MKVSSLTDLPKTAAYLKRIGAEPRSLKSAVIKEQRGKYWTDIAVIRFNRDGSVFCQDDRYLPTEDEGRAISGEFANVDWPEIKPVDRIAKPPAMIKNADAEDVFEFRDASGKIVMVQVRVEKDGEKAYVPWTYWNDDVWRCCEPDGPLPIYNAEKIKAGARVFIHEGAKAARAMQRMVEAQTYDQKDKLAAHPWARDLVNAVHVGWIGGALSPYRTDWSAINEAGIKWAYIVADNDEPGRSAVPRIAKQLRLPTFAVQFTDEFPQSFDLADDFPDELFGTLGDVRHYVGPSFRDCMHPATWATDLIPNPKGKPTPVLRDSFAGMWAYVEEADFFVCTLMPDIIRTQQILDRMLAPFSDVAETSRLIVRAYRGRAARVCYRPDHDGLMVTFRGSSAINLHTPTTIRSVKGDPKPWLEFVKYMFVNEEERREVLKWCATIIAHPDVRMGYGLLLVSERQGIGKTTLGQDILGPLVGPQNVGFPSEADISRGDFNGWMANKRLVVVNEIYSGSSWKAYHSLKSVITDRDVTVNEKYMRQYTIENWCHVVACSNSMRALKMEMDDRRWFYPEITESPWPGHFFLKFQQWLKSGGLQIIKHWAETYPEVVGRSDRAPMTRRKLDLIEGSRSEAQKEAAAVAECLKEYPKPAAVLMKDVVAFVRGTVQGRVFDSDYELRKAMVETGVRAWPDRVKVGGRLQYVIVNDSLALELQAIDDKPAQSAAIRSAVVKPGELTESDM